jgi:hypothetical protein
MNPKRVRELSEMLSTELNAIAASPRRRRLMCEELSFHLWSSFHEELGRGLDEESAANAALSRLGAGEELRAQLQECVPFLERILFGHFWRKENPMSTRNWILTIIATAIIVASYAFTPIGPFVLIGGIALLAALDLFGVTHLLRTRNSRIVALVGLAAVFTGPAIILPALAKLKHDGTLPTCIGPIILGVILTIEGLGFILRGLTGARPRLS